MVWPRSCVTSSRTGGYRNASYFRRALPVGYPDALLDILSFLITSDIFNLHSTLYINSASDPIQRKRYVKLVESVRKKGAEVLIFSSMHESGQRE